MSEAHDVLLLFLEMPMLIGHVLDVFVKHECQCNSQASKLVFTSKQI